MSLNKWWRQFKATWKSNRAPFEWGGILCEYFPQQAKLVVTNRWTTKADMEAAHQAVQQMTDQNRDQIFIATIKVGNSRGYFVLHGSDGTQIQRHFWDALYPAPEAYLDIQNEAIRLARKMKYTSPKPFDIYENDMEVPSENNSNQDS